MGITDVETQCGHIRLNIQCAPPEDYQANRVPAAEICFDWQVFEPGKGDR